MQKPTGRTRGTSESENSEALNDMNWRASKPASSSFDEEQPSIRRRTRSEGEPTADGEAPAEGEVTSPKQIQIKKRAETSASDQRLNKAVASSPRQTPSPHQGQQERRISGSGSSYQNHSQGGSYQNSNRQRHDSQGRFVQHDQQQNYHSQQPFQPPHPSQMNFPPMSSASFPVGSPQQQYMQNYPSAQAAPHKNSSQQPPSTSTGGNKSLPTNRVNQPREHRKMVRTAPGNSSGNNRNSKTSESLADGESAVVADEKPANGECAGTDKSSVDKNRNEISKPAAVNNDNNTATAGPDAKSMSASQPIEIK